MVIQGKETVMTEFMEDMVLDKIRNGGCYSRFHCGNWSLNRL